MGKNYSDGDYKVEVNLKGGSGKAHIESPTDLSIKDGKATATIQWSSSNYDYMIVDGEKYLNKSQPGKESVFEIPVKGFDTDLTVIADTTAMSVPHEIEYQLNFDSSTLEEVNSSDGIGSAQILAGSLVAVIVVAAVIGIISKKVRSK